MPSFSLDDLRPHVPSDARVTGKLDVRFDKVRPLGDGDVESLVWVSEKRAQRDPASLAEVVAAVLVVPADAAIPPALEARACIVRVKSPRLTFARITAGLFAKARRSPGVHPSATIDPEAEIDPTAHVGPHCFVGRAKIGADAVLDGHVHVYDGVTIGERCWLAAGAVLGVDGFGYTPDEDGAMVHVPHLGGVALGADVRIGANACVVRGTLGDTVVGDGTKLDNFVTVGHNARVGRHVLVASHTVIGGSAVIGDHAWLSPQVTILNGVSVGARAVVGVGACVVADVPDGGKIVARAARLLPRALWRLRTPIS